MLKFSVVVAESLSLCHRYSKCESCLHKMLVLPIEANCLLAKYLINHWKYETLRSPLITVTLILPSSRQPPPLINTKQTATRQ